MTVTPPERPDFPPHIFADTTELEEMVRGWVKDALKAQQDAEPVLWMASFQAFPAEDESWVPVIMVYLQRGPHSNFAICMLMPFAIGPEYVSERITDALDSLRAKDRAMKAAAANGKSVTEPKADQ